MLSQREGELYREGFAVYDPRGQSLWLENPYIVGPGREAEALAWWKGFQAARERARLTDQRAS